MAVKESELAEVIWRAVVAGEEIHEICLTDRPWNCVLYVEIRNAIERENGTANRIDR